MNDKIEVAPKDSKSVNPQRPLVDYYKVPAETMDQIISYLTKDPWEQVNPLMNYISINITPIYKNQTDEAKN